MKICGKVMPKAKNGFHRGFCTRPAGHERKHGNGTCIGCGVRLTLANSNAYVSKQQNGYCRECRRRRDGQQAMNHQHLGKSHTFPCGCGGILPSRWEQSSEFVIKGSAQSGFKCRVSRILRGSTNSANDGGYTPIPFDTPHALIRQMMQKPNCYLCGEPLLWAVTIGGRQPHLHHDHKTGEPLGFTHPVCNPRALENEIDRLKKALASVNCKKT